MLRIAVVAALVLSAGRALALTQPSDCLPTQTLDTSIMSCNDKLTPLAGDPVCPAGQALVMGLRHRKCIPDTSPAPSPSPTP